MPTILKLKNSVTAAATPTTLVQGEAAVNITDKKVWVGNAASSPVQILGAGASLDGMAIGGTTAAAGTFTSLSDSGNLTFTGTGNRITGDFSNATISNRVFFQNSTTDAVTALGFIPNGTATQTNLEVYNKSDPNGSNNPSMGQVLINSTEYSIRSSIRGSGTYLPLTMYTGGSERLRIDTSGNVGIGTSSPDIFSESYQINLGLRTTGTTAAFQISGASASRILLGVGTTRTAQLYSDSANFTELATSTAKPLLFSTNSTERMRIDSSGNVGIGTSSPNTKLEVTGAVRATNSGSSGYFYRGYRSGTTSAWYVYDSGTEVQMTVEQANPLLFGTSNTERMRIDSSGNAMIGTTTAGLKLTVQAGVTIVSGDQSTCRLVLQNTTSPGRTFSLVAGTVGVGNDDFTIYDNTASATRVTLKANGEFIIGTSDQGAYNLQCNGTGVWGAGAYVNGSDARIKEDIAPIESGLDVVEKLNPVTYRYKEDWSKDQSTQTGFIAQELLTALNGQIYVDGVVQQGGEYMSVAYQNIIPILTKAIQELNAKVDAQAAEIALLKSK